MRVSDNFCKHFAGFTSAVTVLTCAAALGGGYLFIKYPAAVLKVVGYAVVAFGVYTLFGFARAFALACMQKDGESENNYFTDKEI